MLHDETLFGIVHTWNVNIHITLKISILFYYIHMYYLNLYTCSIGKVVIKTPTVNDHFTYCGIFPTTLNYSPFRKTEIMVLSKYRVQYDIFMSYSVIDTGSITSISLNNENPYKNLLMALYLDNFNSTIEHYYICGPKYVRIIIIIKARPNSESYKVYDGPEQSNKIIDFERKDRNTRTFLTSTFQCTIIAWTQNHGSISFSYRRQNISERIIFQPNEERNISVSKYALHVTSIRTLRQYKLKLTITSLKHSGMYNKLCNYAGLAAFDIINDIHTEISTACKISSDLHHHQDIYSMNPELLLIHYAYPEFGTLTVKFAISTTTCKVIHINTCVFEHDCTLINTKQCAKIMDHQNVNSSCVGGEKISDAMKCHQDLQSQVTVQIKDNECTILQLSHTVDHYPRLIWKRYDEWWHPHHCYRFMNNLKVCRMNNLKFSNIPVAGRLLKYNLKGLLSGKH